MTIWSVAALHGPAGSLVVKVSVTVPAGSTAVNGNISVTASNACGTSTASTLAVTVGSFAFADAGPDQTVCAGTNSITLAGAIGGVITQNNHWDW